MTEGTDAKRFNSGKVPMHLLPLWLLEDLAIHYGKGAEKYDPWNWIQGGSTDTCFGALLRHLAKWQAGEDLDEETETHHMCAVAWNALALLHGYKMGTGRDDRPPLSPPKDTGATENGDAVTNTREKLMEQTWKIPTEFLCEALKMMRSDMERGHYASARGRANDMLILLGCERAPK